MDTKGKRSSSHQAAQNDAYRMWGLPVKNELQAANDIGIPVDRLQKMRLEGRAPFHFYHGGEFWYPCRELGKWLAAISPWMLTA